MAQAQVVTRFAPSPTGALHIGGARTALFAWAFARQHADAGRFLLRIEDTDRARSTAASTRGILRDLKWLGLTWDEGPDPEAEDPYGRQLGDSGPYFQSQRIAIYDRHIQKLLDAGRAYEDAGAVRFRMGKDVAFRDEVYGDIQVKGEQLEDFVIRKADGFPTFHLAVVVDDALMGVTHVFRGQEHLSNTSKHVALQDALGFPRPTYVHMPSILNPDGSKMSKRDKAKVARKAAEAFLQTHDMATLKERLIAGGWEALKQPGSEADQQLGGFLAKENDEGEVAERLGRALNLQLPEIEVDDFRRSGYLPEVVLNYIALLGWNPGGDVERFDKAFIIERFGTARLNKANSKFDRDKLFRFNGDTLQALPPQAFASLLKEHLRAYHESFLHKLTDEQFSQFCEAYRPRARTLDEPAQLGAFFIMPDDEITYDPKAVEKHLAKGDGFKVLQALLKGFEAMNPWRGEVGHELVGHVAAELGVGMGKVAQPLRVALTGNTVSPPLDVTLDILGRESVLERVRRCLAVCGG